MSRLLKEFHYKLSSDSNKFDFEDPKVDPKNVYMYYALKVSIIYIISITLSD